ncbi:MAG: hypothetical protein JWR36_2663 [Glaciihabitans sp.]|jgi:hypothetical protein|nr:hypothetical protein [Glaciihabitans sp.]
MTTRIAPSDDNRDLYARLRGMWSRLDPMPEDLIDDILVRLATENLGDEYALLTLVEHSEELVGTRSLSESRTLEFTDGAITILLRVSPSGSGTRRIDGWLAPASTGTLRIVVDGDEHSIEASPEGRFVFPDVALGRARMWLDPQSDEESGAVRRGFTTPEFEL